MSAGENEHTEIADDVLISLDNYLAWFQVSENIQYQRKEVTMNDLMIRGNLIKNSETYDTIRLTKFVI